MNILKITFKSVKRRYRQIIRAALTTLFAVFFVTAVLIFQENMYQWQMQSNKDRFGDWFIMDIGSRQPDSNLTDHIYIEQPVKVSRSVNVLNDDWQSTGFYVGSFSSEFLVQSHIKLDEGRHPENSDEIAMDWNTLLTLGYKGEIGDPLMHMLRNAADHGLESTIDRLKLGKPQVGTIRLDAYQDGNNVTIEVSDDGAGIDVEKIKRKALEKGQITEEQAEYMTEKDAIDLLFMPAFSTAEKISDVSGRGVGLDVVKNKIEGLGGDVEVVSKLGEGTTFIVRLPLTLAIIQALMVEVSGEKYALPLNSIVTVEEILPEDIRYVHTKEVINLRGSVIPLVRLNEVLDIDPIEKDEDAIEDEGEIVVIVKKGDKQAGLVIDKLLGQQEIVIKSLGKYIHVPKMISGATILGNGEVALIIDSNTLV